MAGKLEELIKKIEADGQVTREEFEELNSAMIADGKLTDDERMMLEQVFSKIRRGELKEV